MPQVVDPCPECQSDDRFYHCHRGCNTPTHVVTCNKCKTDYLTTERIIDYDKRTQAYSRHAQVVV